MSLLNTNIGPERVQVFDQPIGTVQLPGVATSVTAFLISTSHVGAPVQTATAVTSFSDFVSAFGTADEVADDGYYAVEGFFNNAGTGNTAIIVNVGTSPTAADYIGNASNGHGLRALDNQDVVGLVCAPGLPINLALLVQPAVIDYTKTIRSEFGATLTTSFSVLSVPKEIEKANKEVAMLAPIIITSIASNVLQLPSTNLSTIKPGMVVVKAGVYTATITAVNDGLDQVTVAALNGLAPSDSITLSMPSAITWKDQVVNDPSRVSAWYFNSVIMLDESSTALPGDLKTIDPVGHIAGVMARIDANNSIGGVSHAPAGIQYAGLAGIQGLALKLSERIDAEPLRLAFINRLTGFPGSGNVIFGGYTNGGALVTADEQLIQVMRSLQFIKGSLERGLKGFLWENFSPVTQLEVKGAIESFLRSNIHLFPAGLQEAQQFKVISVEPTQNELDQGLLKVRIQVRPNKAVRFIEISLEYPIPTTA